MSRLEEQQQFCSQHGWGDADLFPLPCDASKRSYIRLVDTNRSAMLMDAPPEFENLGAYLQIGEHLKALGVKTPEIYAHDLELGLALIEDFGDDTFTRLLDTGTDEAALYRQATNVLIQIQKSAKAVSIQAPAYNEHILLLEVERFTDWFVPAVRGKKCTQEEIAAFLDEWKKALAPVAADRSMLVVRDFHVDNLMILDKASEIASCGLLDFQDALIGSPAYDLVSLIEDARRDVSPETRKLVIDLYCEAFPDIDPQTLRTHMAILGAQRHVKVLGLFTRLSRQDNKHGYLKHIRRVAALLASNLEMPELAGVRDAIERMVPEYWNAEIPVPLTSLYPENS